MARLSENKTGLLIGFFYGLWHTSWAVLVAAGFAKPLLDWVLALHFMSVSYQINEFQLGKAALLVGFTSVFGYLIGWVLAFLWNRLGPGGEA